MITVNDLRSIVNDANGSRKRRILYPSDLERFVDLVNAATADVHTIRVYSSDGFVANGYKYRADIVYLQATRNPETGEFNIGAGVVDAKRPRGHGALATINSRGV